MDDLLPVITVRLPWAAALRNGAKRVENRGKRIPDKYVGRQIGIHGGAAWDRESAGHPLIRNWWWGESDAHRGPVQATDFTGYFRNVIAVGTLVDVHQAAGTGLLTCCEPWGMPWYNDRRAWHHVFTDMVALPEPVYAVGSLLLPWLLPAEATALVRVQLIPAEVGS